MIVSDNGSTDGSVEIAKRYADKVVHCEERGIGPARHFGALNASASSKYSFLSMLIHIFQDTTFLSYMKCSGQIRI